MTTPLSQTLHQADLDSPAWSFTENQRASFWPRRILHEIAIHRIDAELAAGQQPRIDADTAVDGIDELFYLLPFGHPFRAGPPDLRGGGETAHLHGTDVDVHWLIHLEPDGHTWEHLSDTPSVPPSVTVGGNVADLYLFQYNRFPSHNVQVRVTGPHRSLRLADTISTLTASSNHAWTRGTSFSRSTYAMSRSRRRAAAGFGWPS